MDIKVDSALRKTVEKMDANQDGKISYEEFLTMEFKIALTDKEPEAVAEKADTE